MAADADRVTFLGPSGVGGQLRGATGEKGLLPATGPVVGLFFRFYWGHGTSAGVGWALDVGLGVSS